MQLIGAALVGAVIFLSAFGRVSGLMLAQMHKIVAFVTWLEVYGPILGKTPAPRVQDLVAERPATRWVVAMAIAICGLAPRRGQRDEHAIHRADQGRLT